MGNNLIEQPNYITPGIPANECSQSNFLVSKVVSQWVILVNRNLIPKLLGIAIDIGQDARYLTNPQLVIAHLLEKTWLLEEQKIECC